VQPNGKPYSPDTVAGWWRLLTQMLRDASADFDLPDPTRRVTAPDLSHVPKVREQVTLDQSQVDRLVELAERCVPDRAAEVAFLAYTGCRSGEMYGLHIRDLHLQEGHCVLRHSATRAVLEHTKTGSERDVPIHPKLTAILARHLDRKRSPAEAQSGLVFPNEKGSYRLEQSLAKPFDALSIALGQKVTPQVLRRSLNSNLLAKGYSPVEIQAIMGHTSDAMTARYAHIPIRRKAELIGSL